MYLKICANYIHIFLSVSISLWKKIVLASKGSFFLRIWKLWINHGNHSIGGNTKRCSLQEIFISTQCFLDIQLSCHFVVLLIRFFRDFYSYLLVSLHLIGSDSYEILFNKVGGMQSMERAYNFHELLTWANMLNQLAAIEYENNGLKFDRVHNKQWNVWEDLHLLAERKTPPNLGGYLHISDDSNINNALKEGLKEAQLVLRILYMAPSTMARKKRWFLQPWSIEKQDPKHWLYVPPLKPIAREDRDVEVLFEALINAASELCEVVDSSEDNV